MKIPTLGKLLPQQDIPTWLTSASVPVPYFDGLRLPFTLMDLQNEDEVEATEAIRKFLLLGSKDRDRATRYLFAYFQAIVDAVGEDEIDCRIDFEADVWLHVRPTEIYIRRRRGGDRAIYVDITGNCDWEPEHGLQIVYRRGSELSRVGPQDGHLTNADAYALPEDQDQIFRPF